MVKLEENNINSLHKVGFKKLTSIDKAWEFINKHVKYMGSEIIPTIESMGRITHEIITSKIDVPHFPRSAMDGYAIIAEDTYDVSQHNPGILRVIDDIKISEMSNKILKNGEAIKLTTGSPIPEGANAVIKIEDTKRVGENIEIYFPLPRGKNLQRKGEDIKEGNMILPAKHQIRPQDIGMLLACGESRVKVFKKPSIAIISTGTELKKVDEPLKVGEIHETNSYMLLNFVKLYGGNPIRLEKVVDDIGALNETLKIALKNDIVVFTGGTSVGELDLLPKIMEMNGEILVHGISMRPGSPTAIALVKNKLVFCLPGFPVASIISFEVFVGPYLRKIQGFTRLEPRPKIIARLSKGIPSILGRRDFIRVKIERKNDELIAIPTKSSGSGIISSTVNADGVLILPEEKEGFEKDEKVEVLLYLPNNRNFW
ncbi:MAG: molybdopterin molybdotransferase MoeA [Candidatus Helarchaeota archaeon]